jgi:CheY-like chemotaxis protein
VRGRLASSGIILGELLFVQRSALNASRSNARKVVNGYADSKGPKVRLPEVARSFPRLRIRKQGARVAPILTSPSIARTFHEAIAQRLVIPMTDDRAVIAIVDSDDSLRARLRDLFGAAGLTVELFKSAEEYLKRSKSHLPNCTVLDVQLPGISGLDLQSRLAKAKRKTPLVFLTAHNDVRTSVRAMKAGP